MPVSESVERLEVEKPKPVLTQAKATVPHRSSLPQAVQPSESNLAPPKSNGQFFKHRMNHSVDNPRPDFVIANSAVDVTKQGARILAKFEGSKRSELPT